MVESDFIITRGNVFAGAVSFLFLGITNNELSIPFAPTSSYYQIGPLRYLRLQRYFHLSLTGEISHGRTRENKRRYTNFSDIYFRDSWDESSTRLRKKKNLFILNNFF